MTDEAPDNTTLVGDDGAAEEPADGVAERSGRRVAPLIVAVIAVVMIGFFVVLAGADQGAEEAETELLGRPAPEATGTLDDGTAFDLSRRKGSWVVLNFFDPECGPCIQEHPELVRFAADQESLGLDGAELYSVIYAGTRQEIDAFFAENGGDWSHIYSEFNEFPVAFGVSQVPETWIIDPSGVVQLRLVGATTADQLNSILRDFREQYA